MKGYFSKFLKLKEQIKTFGDVKYGIATQCINDQKIRSNLSEQKLNQYISNLCLKINCKLSGINFRLSPGDPWYCFNFLYFAISVILKIILL